MSSIPLVTRFAPSSTGHLHLGNARTALLNYLAARSSGGRFILRVEDTDETRSAENFMGDLLDDLRWLGLSWDEGPDIGGPHATYHQQQRRAIYEEWLAKLDAAGLTYPCFCTQAELNSARRSQLAAGKPPRYPGTCRNLHDEVRAERLVRGQPAALRFRVPTGQVVAFDDLVHGPQRFLSDDSGDFILRRADGSTACFFSSTIDDVLMEVSLVLRGDDHLTNTPRQILILQALGMPVPRYAHVALLLGMDGSPLSKRHGALSLRDLRRRGYLPAGIRNHLVRLGHNCLSEGWLDEAAMRADFDLARLGRAAARCETVQLRHWQQQAVAHLSDAQFHNWIADHVPQGLDEEPQAMFTAAIRHHVEFPPDVKMWADLVFGRLDEYSPEALSTIREAGEQFFITAAEVLGSCGIESKQAVREIGRLAGRRGAALHMPLRAAITGVTHGPQLESLLSLIAVAEVGLRLTRARQLASQVITGA